MNQIRNIWRERVNPLDDLNNATLIQRYRLDREGILFVNDLIQEYIEPRTNRNNSVSALHKVLIGLRYFANGNIQLTEGDVHGFSQPTISRIINDVTIALSRPNIVSQFISFPNTRQEIMKQKLNFYGMGGFPNVVAVVDGTQVQIQAPVEHEQSYVNRMAYHSINTQVAFDSDSKIVDLVARWPGSTHDSRVLRQSGLWMLFNNGHMPPGNNYVLGDSGYPCKNWLMTPYLNPQPGSQVAYNRAHKRTRSIVERGIGQLKKRWGVLHGEIRLCPEKAGRVILCCGVLHNICKDRDIPLPDNEEYDAGQQPLQYNILTK